ncbi:MAG TPA: glycosyltransferase [Verrucomicrobiae bacterium]|nr:glycosyltransferase [Verrucomicrobiae bacterium]
MSEQRPPVRVLHVIWALDLGGAEQVVLNLVRHLHRDRFEPVVCCLNGRGRFAGGLEEEGIKVIALHKAPRIDWGLVPKLTRLIRDEKIDLVHTHLFTAHLWGRMAAHRAHVPVLSTEHGMDVWRSGWHHLLDSFLVRTNSRMIYVSDKVRDFYVRRVNGAAAKAVVLHNGIDVPRFAAAGNRETMRRSLGVAPETQVLGIVGRLSPEKAHEDFLKLVQTLLGQGKNVTGLIVGDGALKAQLMEKSRLMGLDKNIIFTGLRKDIPELYAAMDVFVLCSHREGFPMTVLEAMAAGVPVVCTDVGGIKECLEDGKDGFLVPPGDLGALAAKIALLIDDKALREKIVARAREKVAANFSVEKMVADHEALYAAVLKERNGR